MLVATVLENLEALKHVLSFQIIMVYKLLPLYSTDTMPNFRRRRRALNVTVLTIHGSVKRL